MRCARATSHIASPINDLNDRPIARARVENGRHDILGEISRPPMQIQELHCFLQFTPWVVVGIYEAASNEYIG
ncbi:unnamed protein product [marine sediment metagenome]|uniref:Uncharacterized protein n=1 Tax=marine sediment metagenome TaxID=412755 RepID=X1LLD7_9ZZZZ